MGVVELVALLVEQPEPVAADLVPADGEDRAVGDGEQRLAELAEDVVAVVVGDVRARRRRTCRCTTWGRRPGRRSAWPSASACTVSGPLLSVALVLRTVARRVAGARLVGGRRRRVGPGRRRRHRGRCGRRRLRGRLGVADLDLAVRGQPAVVGGQMDVELGDEAAVAERALGGAAIDSLRPDGQLAPVAERARGPTRRARR